MDLSIDTNGSLTHEERLSIDSLYRAFGSGDLDLLDQALSEDWQDIPLAPGQKPGRAGMKPMVEAFIKAFPDIKITVHEVIGGQGRAGVRAEIAGTHTGDWFGVAPTGKAFSIALHEFHHLEGGKITHTWHLEDWFSWLGQVGAGPKG